MKRLFLLFFSALLCTAVSAYDAHDIVVDGIYYKITSSSDLTVAVTYRGNYYNSAVYSGSVVIPEKVTYNRKKYSVTSIGEDAFFGCSGLTSVTIPNSVTSIGGSAFFSCSRLTSVDIPNSVTSIGNGAFSGCSGLTSVTIPNSVTSIGGSAFRDCSGLTSVTIPNSVTSIGDAAFSGCSSLTTIEVESGNTKYDSRGNCNAIIETNTNTLIVGCKNTVIPNSVTSIGNSAFSGCKGLINVDIPNSVTSIGGSAFRDCSGLTSVTIPNSVTSIGDRAFQYCSGELTVNCNIQSASSGKYGEFFGSEFTSVIIGDKVTSIGDYAFYGCSGLTSVTIPNSVTSIGEWAFYGCRRITRIDCMAATPPLVSDYTFSSEIYTKTTLNVPEGCADKYKAANIWKEFTNMTAGDVSTNINQTEMRGVMATCSGGIITVSGLTDGETVMFYDANGALLYTGTAQNGTISYAPSASGVIIVKIGTISIKVVS